MGAGKVSQNRQQLTGEILAYSVADFATVISIAFVEVEGLRRVQSLVDGQDDVESGDAIRVGIVGDGFGDGSAFDVKGERLFREIGQAGEVGFAVAVGADLQIGFAHVHETVAELHGDLGVVDGLVFAVANSEIGGADSDAAVDFGDRRGILCLRRRGFRRLGLGGESE